VVDTNSNGIPGVLVSFSSDQGSLSAVTATTNSGGQAVTQLTTSQAATVTATVGAKSGTVKVSVYAAPTIAIQAPTSPTALVASTFTLTVTPGAGAAAISDVTVNFGDATSSSTVDLGAVSGTISVTHSYASPGQYTVTVTVRDGTGQTVSASTPVVVYAAIPFTLSVTASPNTAASNVTLVVFTATPNAGAPAILNYTWDFGDGTNLQTTVPFVPHTYTAVPNGSPSQQLLVSVTATGADGRVGYGSVLITVTQ
jgi:PKD repeat protein